MCETNKVMTGTVIQTNNALEFPHLRMPYRKHPIGVPTKDFSGQIKTSQQNVELYCFPNSP